ncbi:unnamed protein product [Haemonchus placei]|uniref:CST complex subunit TEN1 n=1 Tax=Haemonchus placei TaxID=6290 RepID=A0A0N4WYI3_HAEPC|nr:unnamed protein product [Haemonchus placei]
MLSYVLADETCNTPNTSKPITTLVLDDINVIIFGAYSCSWKLESDAPRTASTKFVREIVRFEPVKDLNGNRDFYVHYCYEVRKVVATEGEIEVAIGEVAEIGKPALEKNVIYSLSDFCPYPRELAKA